MFIFNVNLNKKIIKKFSLFFSIALIIFIIVCILSKKIQQSSRVYIKDDIQASNYIQIPDANYANILKDAYENIDKYNGKKIKYSGFIHRLYDFSENQFVLAREMILDKFSDKAQVVIVGFLCEYEDISSYESNTWVEIEGTITKAMYHTEIPIIKVSSIRKSQCPADPYVLPPEDTYIITEDL